MDNEPYQNKNGLGHLSVDHEWIVFKNMLLGKIDITTLQVIKHAFYGGAGVPVIQFNNFVAGEVDQRTCIEALQYMNTEINNFAEKAEKQNAKVLKAQKLKNQH